MGALPLLPIASGLALRYGAPPELPGALRRFGDVKAATWAEAAVLLVAVPLAALFFGRILPRFLERRAPRGSLSFEWAGAAFAASFFLAQRAVHPKYSLLAGLALAALAALAVAAFRRFFAARRLAVRFARGANRSRRWLWATALLLVFLGGFRARRVALSPVEVFEDGHSLAFSEAYLHGARPYAETYPLHGWGSDGGVDGLAFRLFGPTLRVYRVRTALWSAASAPLLGAASIAALGSGAWGALGFLVSASFSPNLMHRQALAFAALFFLYLAVRRRSPSALVAAGAITGWEILYSFEFGLIVAAGASAGLLFLPTLEARLRRLRFGFRSCGLFAAGILLGTAPFLLILAARGVLGESLRVSFVELPRWVTPVWGLPAGSLWKAILPARDVPSLFGLVAGVGSQFLFALGLLAIAGAALLLRSAATELEPEDRAAWIALCVAALALRGALGRADEPHLWNYSVFAGVPAAWLLRRAWLSRARGALTLLLTLCLLMRLHPVRRAEESLRAAFAGRRSAEDAGAFPPRAGGERVPAGQAAALAAFREAIDARLGPGETFFDFANQPALFFFADRVPPIRFHTVAQYESPERQREVIEALRAKKPPIVVLTETFYANLDGVSNSKRAPEVVRYLAEHYEKEAAVGDWRLARRKPGD